MFSFNILESQEINKINIYRKHKTTSSDIKTTSSDILIYLKTTSSDILEGEIVEEKTSGLEVAIQKAKKNIFVSKSWNKRVDNKIQKVYSDLGEEFTINLLNELYKNLQEEVKTTLVQYISGMIKNIKNDDIPVKTKGSEAKPKSSKGTNTPVQEVQEVREELTEGVNSEVQKFKEEIKKIAKKQLDTLKYYEFMAKMVTAKTFEKVNELVMEYTLNKALEGTEPEEKKEEPYVLPERSERRKAHLKKLVSDIKNDLEFYGAGYKGIRKKADLVEILLDSEERYNK